MSRLDRTLTDFFACLRFFTRLPLPRFRFETSLHAMPEFGSAAAMVPAAGAIVGLLGAGALLGASSLGFAAPLAAPLTILVLVLLTGALHEDGLADCADGFGGGSTPARKLEIMRDSRIGSYGGVALALSLYLRAASLTLIAVHGLGLAAAVLIAAGAVSRTFALLPLVRLPPARADGAGVAAGKLPAASMRVALLIATALALLPLLAGSGFGRVCVAWLAVLAAAYGMTRLAKAQIGGQTGDVVGATQQVVELTIYLVFATQS